MNSLDAELILYGSLPWHVVGSFSFVVDSSSLASKNDIGIDAWRWSVNKTKTTSTSALDMEGCYKPDSNKLNQYRVVKRHYKCTANPDMKRSILAVYPPGVLCTSASKPFQNCTGNVMITYQMAQGVRVIPPDPKARTYPSVVALQKEELSKGMGPARATYNVEKSMGGITKIENSSKVPRRLHAYEESRKVKQASKCDDPLMALLQKQREDGRTGHPVIRRVTMDDHSYSLNLFDDTIIDNIANFCCTELPGYKSAFMTDFTFELLKDPPFFALVGTFKNTSLHVKSTNRCPVMLGPILLCHKRDEATVRMFYDAILDACEGIRYFLQVLGCDGEKSLFTIPCKIFPTVILLLCLNHSKKNIKEKLNDLLNDPILRKSVYVALFGDDDYTEGLIAAGSPTDFEIKFNKFYAKYEADRRMTKFLDYLTSYKLDQFKHHLIAGVVRCSEIVDSDQEFTTNAAECINSVIKDSIMNIILSLV